jgi:hypothetical protein
VVAAELVLVLALPSNVLRMGFKHASCLEGPGCWPKTQTRGAPLASCSSSTDAASACTSVLRIEAPAVLWHGLQWCSTTTCTLQFAW